MSVLEREPPQINADDTAALFEQARRRTRRRRRRGALVALLAVSAAAALYAARSGAGPRALAETASTPFANVRAFAHEGELAFVSRGRLWVLDGAHQRLTAVSRPQQTASDPQFSPDGRWLAFTVDTSQLWVARADGVSPTHVGPDAHGSVDWLPDGRLLAGDGLWRVRANATVGRAGTTPAGLVAWAPDGSGYAFISEQLTSSHDPNWTRVQRLSISGSLNGPRRTIATKPLSFTPRGGLRGGLVDEVDVLPHREGTLYRLDPDDADAADGLELVEVAPGGRSSDLGFTLGLPLTLGVAGTFAITSGANRYAWQTKAVEICDARTARCAPLATASGALSFDPAYSTRSGALAWVQAPSSDEANVGQAAVQRWYATHSLWIRRSGSPRATRIAGASGAAAPVWSRDGRTLLFVAADALWLLPTPSSRPVRITAPLFASGAWPSYYGEVGWSSQFAWSSRA